MSTPPHHPSQRIVQLDSGINPECLASLVRLPIDMACDEKSIWLRCDAHNETLQTALQQLPGVHYRVEGDRFLVRAGHQVAELELPPVTWQRLSEGLQLRWPLMLSAGRLSGVKPVHWQLVRGGSEQPAAAAIMELSVLKDWAELAPQWRLESLRYVVRRQSPNTPSSQVPVAALVVGNPLPPVDCQYLIQFSQVLIPAGTQWLPRLEVDWVMRSFEVSADQWLVWLSDHAWSILDDEMLQPLSRSSLRQLSAQVNGV